MCRITFLKNVICILIVFSILSITCAPIGFAAPVELEDAAAESGNAMTISADTEYKASITTGDADWYKITTDNRLAFGQLIISSNKALKYVIYDSDLSEVYADTYSKGNELSERFKLNKNSNYYLKVCGYALDLPDYKFSFKIILDNAEDHQELAKSINTNTIYEGAIDGPGDVDWFKFSPKSRNYQINVFADKGIGYALYDSDLRPIKQSDYASNINTGILRMDANKVYYLKLYPWYTPNYKISISEFTYPDRVHSSQYSGKNPEFNTFYGYNTNNSTDLITVSPNALLNDNQVICLPTDSYIVLEMTSPLTAQDNINEIAIYAIGYRYDTADVYVSTNAEKWIKIGAAKGGQLTSFDITNTNLVKYIKIVGTNSRTDDTHMGIDIVSVEVFRKYNQNVEISPTTQLPQQGACALYSADVSPKKGYSNRTDNDNSGTSFKYTLETSTDITDIFVLTETNWKITSNYFNYISKDEVNGNLKWTFELNINSPGSRAFNIVGVDASGRETSPAYVSFEVVARGSIYDDVSDDSSYVNEVKYLKENNIITGKENNNFDPEGYLTRAEAATIICRIAGFNNLSGADSGFSDVPSSHWASGYVKKARDLGIISGIGNNMFDPEGILTGYQFVKMVVCQLGYNDVVQNQYGNDSYPNGFYYYAKDKLNLLKNIQNGDYSVPMNRSDASVLAYNAMHAPKYDPQSAAKNEVVGNGANSLSEAGRQFIKNQEGLRLNMYDDDKNYDNGWQNPTIGYGTLVDASLLSELGASEPSQSISITQAKAEELFERGVRYREEKFNNLLAKENVKLTQNQYDAIMSWMYNFSFERWNSVSHRLKRCVYEGVTDEVTVKEAFTTWCLKDGIPSLALVERRLREANIYLYNNYGTSGTENGENTYYLGIKQYEIANPNAPESEYNPSIFFKSGSTGSKSENTAPEANVNTANPVVYSQSDSRWGNYSFYHATDDNTGESWPTNIATGGCSVLALVNAVKFLTGKDLNPKAVADFAIACGARTPGSANKITLCNKYVNMTEADYNALAWPELASNGVKKSGSKTWTVNNSEVTNKNDLGYNMLGKSLGINYKHVKFELNTIKNHLLGGGVAIVSVKTSTGHVVCLAGYDESKGFLYLDSLKTSAYWKKTIEKNNDDVALLWK